jgi:hypothetical protein
VLARFEIGRIRFRMRRVFGSEVVSLGAKQPLPSSFVHHPHPHASFLFRAILSRTVLPLVSISTLGYFSQTSRATTGSKDHPTTEGRNPCRRNIERRNFVLSGGFLFYSKKKVVLVELFGISPSAYDSHLSHRLRACTTANSLDSPP